LSVIVVRSPLVPTRAPVTSHEPGRCPEFHLKLLAAQLVTEATSTHDMTAMEHEAVRADDHDHGAQDRHAQGHNHAHGAAGGIEWKTTRSRSIG
jgi:hypothetical protein